MNEERRSLLRAAFYMGKARREAEAGLLSQVEHPRSFQAREHRDLVLAIAHLVAVVEPGDER